MSFDRQRTFELWWITNGGFEWKVRERKNAGVCACVRMRQTEHPKLWSTEVKSALPSSTVLPLNDGYELDRIQCHSIQFGAACNSPIYICIHKTNGTHFETGPSFFCAFDFVFRSSLLDVDVMRNSAYDEARKTKGLPRRIATPENVFRQK